MGLPCARREDIVMGICYHPSHETPIPYIGVIIGGADKSYINNQAIAQESNIIVGFCGHIGTIVTHSTLSKTENLGMARMFDLIVGEGCVVNIITASENTNTG